MFLLPCRPSLHKRYLNVYSHPTQMKKGMLCPLCLIYQRFVHGNSIMLTFLHVPCEFVPLINQTWQELRDPKRRGHMGWGASTSLPFIFCFFCCLNASNTLGDFILIMAIGENHLVCLLLSWHFLPITVIGIHNH